MYSKPNPLYSCLQFQRARTATCKEESKTCCRKSTFFGKAIGLATWRDDDEEEEDDDEEDDRTNRRCGRRNQGFTPRISDEEGKEDATFAEWPHMCIVLRRVKISGVEQTYYVGGASLISPAVILTAAHILKYDILLKKGITYNRNRSD